MNFLPFSSLVNVINKPAVILLPLCPSISLVQLLTHKILSEERVMPLQCVFFIEPHTFFLSSLLPFSTCCQSGPFVVIQAKPINITKAALFNFSRRVSFTRIISERCIIHVIGNMRSRSSEFIDYFSLISLIIKAGRRTLFGHEKARAKWNERITIKNELF